MGGCSSRPQEAPPVPEDEEDTPRVVLQVTDNPEVEEDIQRALADESATTLRIWARNWPPPPLTVNDARHIIACLENPQFDTLHIVGYDIHDDAVLNVFRVGLPLCTAIKTVSLVGTQLGIEDLARLRLVFHNTSVMILDLYDNNIQGQGSGEVLRDLLVGNDTLRELNLNGNPIGPEGAIGLGRGLADNHGLQILLLYCCNIRNDGLANLLPADGMNNNCLTHLYLNDNGIQGAEGGRQVSLLLQRFPSLTVLKLSYNNLGPLGARALAPGLAVASLLEWLVLHGCHLGNDGVANLIPDGQVNTSLTTLNLLGSNDVQGPVGGENVVALASRCANLDSLDVERSILSDDQRRRLKLLLDPKQRLCIEASALGGATFPILFRFVEEAHRHEHGLSAIFVILQNDGDDYFCTALNRAIE